MNYTGGPSISGCRPVLPLYPTHHFCQYLLGIFITFTNSSLFCRAFSTNSRSPLRQRLSLWERCSTSPSLLRNATSPTEGRLWHSGKLLLFARGSPTRGAVERSETERLYEGEPDREPLLGSTSPSLLRNATSPTEGRPWHSAKFSFSVQSFPLRQRLPY